MPGWSARAGRPGQVRGRNAREEAPGQSRTDETQAAPGSAGGALQGNRHLVQPARTPMSNLLLTLLDKLGCHEERFGDSTAPLAI